MTATADRHQELTPVILVIHTPFALLRPFPTRRKLTASGRGRKARRTGNGTRRARAASLKAEVAVAPPRTLATEAKGRGGGRSRAAMGASRCEAGFHETFQGGDERLFGAWSRRRTGEGRGNRPVARDGRGPARGFGPESRPERATGEASAEAGVRESGEAFGRRRDPKRDFERLHAARGSSACAKASAKRVSKGRPEGFRPRCEPEETARLRPGPTRTGNGGGISVRPRRPDGDRRGACPSAETHRVPNGASRPRCGIRGKRPGPRPRRDPEAAQREMASPPSDGSQGWDKWGPVATPAPIIFLAVSSPDLRRIRRLFSIRRPGF
jgi:hypothetical protein